MIHPPSTPRRRAVATRLDAGRILLVVGLVVFVGFVAASWFFSRGTRGPVKETGETPTPYVASNTHYEVVLPMTPPPKPEPVDTITPKLNAIMAKLAALEQEMEELRKRKTTTVVHNPPAPPPAPAPPRQAVPLTFITHELKDVPPPPKGRLYTLAPGATVLPCVVYTKIVSDVEGFFTAKVTTNVYDTETGRHLLVPQNSTILGNDQSRSLIYGDERMDTVSLTLTLPDGRSVELGRAPVTDQEGVAGLTGDVNHHFWRLFGAVFIGGALKGGMTALQVAASNAAGAGQVATGITSLGNQATSTVVQPYINTRPTITVYAGQVCNVLLTKKLELPAMWQ
jgi:type IV secretory pathway VirB10-like protein